MLALFAMGLGVIVIANDFTALNVALPAMEQDFDVDVGTIQWTVNAYALVFGMGLVTGGRLADMLGRRKIFFIGTGIFAGFSLLGAIAPSALALIGARVGMGVGGALMWPAILGMTFAALPADRAGLAGGLDPRHRRARERARAPDRRRAHRRVQLAGDLLAQPADRRLRRARDGQVRPRAAGGGDRAADRLPRDRHRLRRARPDPARPRSGGRLGLDGHPRAGDVRGRGRAAGRLPRDRAPGRRGGADPARRARQQGLPGRLPDGAHALRRLLLDRPLRAAADGEGPRLQRAQGRLRDAADARSLRRGRLHHRTPLRPPRRAAGDHRRHGPARRRAAGGLVLRRRLELRRAHPRACP